MLRDRPKIKATLMGTRKGDPNSQYLSYFSPTDGNWPSLMRVNPIINWEYRSGICVWYLFSLKFSLRTETVTKNWVILQNFNSWMINWPKHEFCQIAKCQMAFLYCIIQELKFFKIVQLLLSQFLSWEDFMRETRKNIKHIFRVIVMYGSLCVAYIFPIRNYTTKASHL